MSNSLESKVDELTTRLFTAETHINNLINTVTILTEQLATQKALTTKLLSGQLQQQQKEVQASNICPAPLETIIKNNPDERNSSQPNFDEINWDDLDCMLDEGFCSAADDSTKTRMAAVPIVDVPLMSNLQTHKHAREDSSSDLRNIKVVRYDSLSRIMGYTHRASAVSDKDLIKVDVNKNYDDERKLISGKIFHYMSEGHMDALSRYVSDYFCDSVEVCFHQIDDCTRGKAEAMMLFSLLHETYPDGIWKILKTEVSGKVVTYLYKFMGTNTFDTRLAVSFKHVKEHQRNSFQPQLAENNFSQQSSVLRSVSEYNPRNTQSNSVQSSNLQLFLQSTGCAGNISASSSFSFPRSEREAPTPSPRSGDHEVSSLMHASSLLNGLSGEGSSSPSSITLAQSTPLTQADGGTDVIKATRRKGNNFHRTSFTLQNPPSRTPSITAEQIDVASRPFEEERRKLEVTFNDFNLIVKIVVTPTAF